MLTNQVGVDFYLNYSESTDPGKFSRLYDGLPDSLLEICEIINCQLIHPAKVSQYKELKNVNREDDRFQNMEDILCELVKRNPEGLSKDRLPTERIILACGHFARFLASVLKYKGIPARIRVGFTTYVSSSPDIHVDHWICEVWDKKKEKWLYVDPDVKMVDFDRERFELAKDVWIKARENKIEPHTYGYHPWVGIDYVKGNLCHDYYSCLNNELIYWEGPELFFKSYQELNAADLQLFDEIASLLEYPECNILQLQQLHRERKELQLKR